MPFPGITYAPDGLAGGASAFARRPARVAAGVANSLLSQLPLGIAILDTDLQLHFWNDVAADLFARPALVAVEAPHLTEVLACVPGLLPKQRDRIAAFVKEQMEASRKAEPESFLRLSLGRERRLGFQLRGLDARRWMLVIDDGRMFGGAERHQSGHGDAWLDPLTGLSNRRHFNEVLREVTENADAIQSQALLIIDLDRFKPVNDTMGHAVGDALLCLVAKRLSREIRDNDLLSRLGGDEFAILITHGEQAESLGDRLVEILSRPFVVEGELVHISASVGIARFPEHGTTADTIMRHAELALYDAKAAGRRMCRVFSTAMAEQAQTRRDLETDLRRALTLGELSLAYQPQLNVRTRTVTGFEALLRWHHPARGDVPPGVFIPVAEEIGCIAALGEWVLQTACKEAARWTNPLTVAVNVSPRQMEQGERLVAAVDQALAASGLDPRRLELEITESSLMPEGDGVLATLRKLHERGIRIAMDDFGTGYSSLSQLRSFPFSKVKIDRSFVSGRGQNLPAVAVIRAIATIGSGLGMATVAEGVETAEQASLVEAEGCTDIQGYLISRPVPSGDIEDLVRQYSPSEV